jgi:hypothetical protein
MLAMETDFQSLGTNGGNDIMKLLKTLAASALLSALAAAPAFAQSGDNEITYISPSIIMIGTPDPCDNGGCEEPTVITAKADGNAALVDANGMPTSMPVIMRPSVDTTVIMPAPETAAAPAIAPAAPATAAEPTPEVTAEAAPAPVQQAPAADAPKVEGQPE